MRMLDGTAVVVFGAGSIGDGWGNGRACAYAYAQEGAAVMCVDAHTDRAQATADAITDFGGIASVTTADATDERDVQAAIDLTRERFGRVDVVHCNVGIGGSTGAPDVIPPADWDREFAVNVTTAYLGIRCAVPVMRAQGGGVITTTSSILATRYMRNPSVAYTASKAAVEALTRSCALAYGADNIRVNCIRIGFSETPLLQLGLEARGMDEDRRREAMDRSRRKVPLRHEHTDPFDVANAAVFLASAKARNITGVVLNVDGGLEHAPL